MAALTQITIARVAISLHSDPPLALEPWETARYGSFLGGPVDPALAEEIHIRVEVAATGGMLRGKQPIFDGNGGWGMWVDGPRRWAALHPRDFSEPLWLAGFDAAPREVTLYCSARLWTEVNGPRRLIHPVAYPLDLILLMYWLAGQRGMILHAAGLDWNGRGCVFPGCSGAGKSTLARALMDRPGSCPLSDDRVIVRVIDGEYRVFGTPWLGTAGIGRNHSAPLRHLLFLKQDTRNALTVLRPAEVMERLLPVSSVPWFDAGIVPALLDDLGKLSVAVPGFELSFLADGSVASFLERELA